jgi:hypothetical protein
MTEAYFQFRSKKIFQLNLKAIDVPGFINDYEMILYVIISAAFSEIHASYRFNEV